MERKNNYEIQAAQARALFCARDLDAVAREHGLRQEGQWLHLRLLGEPYRVSRWNGHIERGEDGRWLPADGFDETLTIFDLLCDAKPGRARRGDVEDHAGFRRPGAPRAAGKRKAGCAGAAVR